MIRKIRDLAQCGVPDWAISNLIQTFNQQAQIAQVDYTLTALQEAVLWDPRAISGTENLLIAGPTSSGKTLVAQAIVAAMVERNPDAKIFYLVPLRALVTEKYQQFKQLLEGKGTVLPLSADYPHSDLHIMNDSWTMAVLVFDKVYAWFSNEMMANILFSDNTLIIVDELQILEQEERGEKLEVILSLVRWYQLKVRHEAKPRIVAMAAFDESARQVAYWLRAISLPELSVDRPVPLYEGWLTPQREELLHVDSLRLYAHSISGMLLDPRDYPEKLKRALYPLPSGKTKAELADALIERCIELDLRVLVYCAGQEEAQNYALHLRKKLSSGSKVHLDSDLQASLDALEDSHVKGKLSKTLSARVGFHHGHMTRTERKLVEEAFLSTSDDPPIKVLIATPTLSMGINLPADIVLMLDHHTFQQEAIDDETYEIQEVTLSVLAYRNFAGRAGRYRPGTIPEFGCCLLLLDRWKEYREVEHLLYARMAPIRPSLLTPRYGLHPHILTVLAAISVKVTAEYRKHALNEVMQLSYAWACATKQERSLFSDDILQAIEQLSELNLLENDEYAMELTRPGMAVASFHLSYRSLQLLLEIAAQVPDLWPHYPFDLLFLLAELPEIRVEYPRAKDLPKENPAPKLQHYFQQTLPLDAYLSAGPLAHFLASERVEQEELLKHMRVGALCGWLDGLKATRITEAGCFPKLSLHQLERLAEKMAICVSALRLLCQQSSLNNPDNPEHARAIRQLWIFERSLHFGLPLEELFLPVVVSLASDEHLTRNSYREISAALGEWTNVQQLIGPPPSLPTRTIAHQQWSIIQNALQWWLEFSRISASTPDSGLYLLFQSLRELSIRMYTGRFTLTTHVVQDPLQTMVNTDAYERLLKQVYKRISAYRVESFSQMRSLVMSVLERAPLRLDLREFHRLLPILGIYDQEGRFISTVELIPGKLTQDKVKNLRRGGSSLIVICVEPPDPDVLISPKRVRLLITLEALVAGAEFVIGQPRYLQRLLSVLLNEQAYITSIEALFNTMFASEA